MNQYQEYHPKICTQCGGVNPGYPVVYSYGEFRCACMSDPTFPKFGTLEKMAIDEPSTGPGKSVIEEMRKNYRNQLLDELIAQCEQPPHVVNIEYLKSLKK